MGVITFEQNNCSEIRSYIDSYVSNELAADKSSEVSIHLQSCARCYGEVADRSRVKTMLRRGAQRGEAPAHLRSRIQREIRRQSSSVRWPRWTLIAAAAGVLIAATAGFLRLGLNGFGPHIDRANEERVENLLAVGLSDHIVCAVGHDLAGRRFTRSEMSEAMGPEFSGLVDVVEQNSPSHFEIVVGHRCKVNGREFVHLILRSDDSVLSVTLTRKDGDSFAAVAESDPLPAPGVEIYESGRQNYQVAGFETRDYFGFTASDLSREGNLSVATSLAPAIRDFLDKIGRIARL